MRMTVGELHSMDFGTHMGLLEEWNESSKYTWHDDVEVIHDFPHSTVIHRATETTEEPKQEEILVVAQYKTDGEGDIVSMIVADRQHPPNFDYIGKLTEEG